MFRRIPITATVVATGAFAWLASGATAQTSGTTTLVSTRASAAAGHVHGIVRDDTGGTIDGASVLAMGETIASVRSDARGRFTLALPPGDYILRATRTGYVSTSRVPVRVQTAVLLERNITLTRQESVVTVNELDDSHAHTELAWRLRHLTRSVLRDGDERFPADAPPSGDVLAPGGSLFNRALERSARAASAFFTQTDFDGQVNFVTTGFSAGTAHWLSDEWPRGVAYAAVGAPVGGLGDWRVHGAVASGQQSSWVLLGEYESRQESAHAFRLGVSYGSQGMSPATNSTRWSAATSYARSVAGVYGNDHWTMSPVVQLDYGLRLDRYDYIETPQLVSGHTRLRARILPGTFALAGASRLMVAPGADEFLPPVAGPWLPPEHTFSAIARGAPLAAEQIERAEIGLAHQFGAGDRTTLVEVRRFREQSGTQMATVFGLDDTRGLGHYFVGSPGSVDVSGWTVGLESRLASHLRGRVEYTVADAEWTRGIQSGTMARLAPAALRPDTERLHDVTATVDADLRVTATRVTVAFRADAALRVEPGRALGGRFDVQVHQALPFQPLGHERLELLFAARTLFRDLREAGAFYDELLTVSPPLRFMAGVQVRF